MAKRKAAEPAWPTEARCQAAKAKLAPAYDGIEGIARQVRGLIHEYETTAVMPNPVPQLRDIGSIWTFANRVRVVVWQLDKMTKELIDDLGRVDDIRVHGAAMIEAARARGAQS